MKKIIISTFLLVLITSCYSETKASWMQGNWGVSYRIPGGDINYAESLVDEYQVTAAVEHMAAIPGLKWVQLNLTNGAFGDRFIVPVAEVEAINPMSAPNNPSDLYDPGLKGEDLFEQLAIALQAKGIKVIAYIATQGPAMLKHGARKAMDNDTSIPNCKDNKPLVTDADNTVFCSANMNRWRDHVLATYPSTSLHRSSELAMVNIVETLSNRYGTLIDGWWFDHSDYGDHDLLGTAALSGNPDAILSFNQGQKVPLINNPDTAEDFTFGHPNPMAKTIPSDDQNLPMLTSIESTLDGIFPGVDGDVGSLGHMFLPLQDAWNGGMTAFSEDKGTEWLSRALSAGGAITWALDQNGDAALGEPRLFATPQTRLMKRMNFNLNTQLHLNLDGADGTLVYDGSLNHHTATAAGITFVSDAIRGRVANFSSNTDTITTDSYKGIMGTSARTTMAWLKTADTKGTIVDFGKKGTGERWWMRIVSGKLNLITQDNTIKSSVIINDDVWHHIAVVAPDNLHANVQVYIDGILDTAAQLAVETSTTFDTQPNTKSNVFIGTDYIGLMDKVIFHDRALPQVEIEYAALVNSTEADLDMRPATELKFDEIAGAKNVIDTASWGHEVSLVDDSQPLATGDTTTGRPSVYSFNGLNEIVMTRNTRDASVTSGYNGINGADPRTVMAWIKASNGNGVITQWGNHSAVDGQQYIVSLESNVLVVDIQGAKVTGTANLNDNTWHHIAVVSPDGDLSNTQIYIDGVLENSSLSGSATSINTYTLNSKYNKASQAVTLKSMDVTIGKGFIGSMDDFKIIDQALNKFEIEYEAGQ